MEFAKQTTEPLFPKLLWNRPVSKSGAGRLLVIGGHRDEFNDIQAVYQLALAGGIGAVHVVMPDSLRKLLGDVPDMSFVPASPSGSLSKSSLGEILHLAQDYDAIALGANLSNNSESAILAESILNKYSGPLIAFDECLRALKHQIAALTDRPHTLIVASMTEIFGIANNMHLPLNIKDGGAINKLEIMEEVAEQGSADYLLIGRDMVVSSEQKLSLTTAVSSMNFFANASMAIASVFWTQNPSKPFEALTTAAYVLQQVRAKLTTTSDEALTTTEIQKAIAEVMRNDSW
jgi:NAD(P)H-hydrate repair Nnr-like enzyme with NAD(P)H-hydrate dehydratase domain